MMAPMHAQAGIRYAVTRKSFVVEADVSARSAKWHMPGLLAKWHARTMYPAHRLEL
jgi:hypothetical protein